MRAFLKDWLFISGILFLILCVHTANGQGGRTNIDSGIASVQYLSSDTDKVSALLELVPRAYCEDSVYKIGIAKKAKELAENAKWQKGISTSNIILGQIYFDCSRNYNKAFEFFEANVKIAHAANDKVSEAASLQTVAKYRVLSNEYPLALEYYDKALAVNAGMDVDISILGDKGVVYKSIGAYSDALYCYDSSLRKIEALGKSKKKITADDSGMEVALYVNLGDLYLSNKEPDKALSDYTKANVMANAINSKVFVINSLIGIGTTYRAKKDYPRSISYFQEALNNCKGLTNFKYEVRVLNEIANTYLDTWSYTDALTYADSALRLGEAQGYIALLSSANATLGNVYLKQEKYDLAIFSLKKALEISKQTNTLSDEREAWRLLTDAYQQNKQWPEAFNALNNYHLINDSMAVIGKANEIMRHDLEATFKGKQVVDSMKQAINFDREIKHQLQFTYTTLIGLGMVVLLSFFIYRNYKTQKKYNELLSKEKTRHLAHIEEQSNVLSDIAHTQAHDVRGPVATILGLIQLFNHDDPTDPVNKEVIENLGIATNKLDNVVKEVVYKENRLRYKDHNKAD